MYRYSEPSISQYESFFNPIPLEFVQQQFERRQKAYDEGYGMAIAAKDQFGGVKVGAPDIAYKNQLVDKFVDDTDKMVQEQFGGDWGKAAKTIARSVTDVRNNDFWQKAQIMDQLREEERKLIAQYGNDAMVFNSLQDKSVYDPKTGKTIDPNLMGYDIVKRGDWGKTIDEIFAKIKPNTNLWGLSQTDFGYLKSGRTTEISADGIKKLAADKNIQNAILSAHPEMSRAFNELPQERTKWFGNNYDDLGTAVQSMILGRTSTMPFKQQDDNYLQDWQAKQAAENTAEQNANPYFASFSKTPTVTNTNSVLENHRKMTRGVKFNDKGFVVDQSGVPVSKEVINTLDPLNPFGTIVSDREDTKKVTQYYNNLVKQYPELGKLSPKDAFSAYEKYLDKTNSETRLEANLRLEDSSNNIKNQLFSNINSANFKSLQFASTGDVFDNNSIIDKLGYKDYTEFEKEIKNKDISPKINFREARLSITVPNRKGKGVKPETVYFSPDEQTQDMLNRAQLVTEAYYNPNTIQEGELKPMPILDYTGKPTSMAVYVEGKGDIVNGNDKKIWLVDYKNKTRQPISLDQYYEMVTKQIDTRFNNYQGKIGNPGKL
jgi:hypothetical protein